MITLENICFSYGEKTVFTNLSLRVKEGNSVCITGPNGSGKTTLSLLLSGIIQPITGTLEIDSVTYTEEKEFDEARRKVGIVFENPDNQFITTSVERELAFGLENLGMKRDEIRERVEQFITRFSLGELRYRSPHTLSGGEKQKVALASILIANPKYLILDEPTVFLDPLSRAIFNDAIEDLRGNITTILISQFIDEVLLGDEIFLLEKYKLEGPLKKEDIFQRDEFQYHTIKFLNTIKKEGIYERYEIPTVEKLCNAIEGKLSKR
jgi:energy-coupling factor transporter ATP-binding protein EcfA2